MSLPFLILFLSGCAGLILARRAGRKGAGTPSPGTLQDKPLFLKGFQASLILFILGSGILVFFLRRSSLGLLPWVLGFTPGVLTPFLLFRFALLSPSFSPDSSFSLSANQEGTVSSLAVSLALLGGSFPWAIFLFLSEGDAPATPWSVHAPLATFSSFFIGVLAVLYLFQFLLYNTEKEQVRAGLFFPVLFLIIFSLFPGVALFSLIPNRDHLSGVREFIPILFPTLALSLWILSHARGKEEKRWLLLYLMGMLAFFALSPPLLFGQRTLWGPLLSAALCLYGYGVGTFSLPFRKEGTGDPLLPSFFSPFFKGLAFFLGLLFSGMPERSLAPLAFFSGILLGELRSQLLPKVDGQSFPLAPLLFLFLFPQDLFLAKEGGTLSRLLELPLELLGVLASLSTLFLLLQRQHPNPLLLHEGHNPLSHRVETKPPLRSTLSFLFWFLPFLPLLPFLLLFLLALFWQNQGTQLLLQGAIKGNIFLLLCLAAWGGWLKELGRFPRGTLLFPIGIRFFTLQFFTLALLWQGLLLLAFFLLPARG